MEIKKSCQADLEGKRPMFFLMGLVFVLSLCYVAMEYTSTPKDLELDIDLLEDVAQDFSFKSRTDEKDMVSVPHSEDVSKVVTMRVKAVDTPVPVSPRFDDRASLLLDGEGEALSAEAKVEESIRQAHVGIDGNMDGQGLEALPDFPGGWRELMKWLTNNLNYPPQAQRQKKEGRVVVSFIVNKDGTLADVKLAKSVDPLLDREALRVVRMMPRWKPGKEKGEPCRSMVVLPVVFKL